MRRRGPLDQWAASSPGGGFRERPGPGSAARPPGPVRPGGRADPGGHVADAERSRLAAGRHAELREEWEHRPHGLRECVVHGDTWVGNVVRATNGPALLAFERASVGPPEWTLGVPRPPHPAPAPRRTGGGPGSRATRPPGRGTGRRTAPGAGRRPRPRHRATARPTVPRTEHRRPERGTALPIPLQRHSTAGRTRPPLLPATCHLLPLGWNPRHRPHLRHRRRRNHPDRTAPRHPTPPLTPAGTLTCTVSQTGGACRSRLF
ncbi:phosphotransferase [Streptomyces sp. NPDC050704]|uniref:phosphotransferase family protein n=1 Tax=Streptomyces sp. NPDC050704 TaxID=3157219 RepID=UPI00344A87A2